VAHLIAQEWGLPFFVLGDGYGQETVGSSGELHLYPPGFLYKVTPEFYIDLQPMGSDPNDE